MKHRMKNLICVITDHLNDSKKDYKYAKIEKEEKDSEMANFYIATAKERMSMAKKALDKGYMILRQHETKERGEGVETKIVQVKIDSWNSILEIYKSMIDEMETELSNFKYN